MRISRYLAPVAVLGVLALAGCEGGAQSDGKAVATPSVATSATTATSTPTATPTPTSTPDPVMPVLHGQTYRQAQDEFKRLDIPATLVTATALHKDVTLPQDHDGWYICGASPQPGTAVTATTGVVLDLAERTADCETSFHGYLHQKNDPAYTPPQTTAPQPKPAYTPQPKPTYVPAPALTKTATKPAGSAMITCSDGKAGYACTSNGHPVVDGQFCPKADRGRTLKATNGTMVTCSYDPSVTPYRWQ
ncbi:hypothetical protein J7E98_12445 [Streptomyces sp. ISL-86]|nr:hypothetical protein [Streptomyces sp. ISL-86]